MSNLLGYKNLPLEILNQINSVVDIWKRHLGDNLIGVYLHGSIVLNAFNPDSGDIDILVVVKDSVKVATKLEIAKDIIKIDRSPCPLEMSAVKQIDAKNWKTPGNCVFHYSDFWTKKYLERFKNPNMELYVADHEFPDADVTSYIKLLKQCGIVLYGEEIQEVFADVSDEDFWSAISADIENYDFHDYDARYLASNVLILGRILSFKREKRIFSKYEGGLWMIKNVPENLRYIPELAMKIWYEGEDHILPDDDLKRLRNYLVGEIKS
ncbi:MAG: aminoglycoside adenylyltransferase domain-containing protein [Lachnospiraceae bacterium]